MDYLTLSISTFTLQHVYLTWTSMLTFNINTLCQSNLITVLPCKYVSCVYNYMSCNLSCILQMTPATMVNYTSNQSISWICPTKLWHSSISRKILAKRFVVLNTCIHKDDMLCTCCNINNELCSNEASLMQKQTYCHMYKLNMQKL